MSKSIKKAIVYAVTNAAFVQAVLSEQDSRLALLEAARNADVRNDVLMYDAQSARDYMRECCALRLAQKPLRFATFDVKANAYHLSMVKGTTSKKSAADNGKALIGEVQAKHNAANRQWWSRLLIEAGVAPVNKAKGGKKGTQKAKQAKGNGAKAEQVSKLWQRPADAARFFQLEASIMVKTLNANAKGFAAYKPNAKLATAYRKLVSDFTLAVARITKAK